MSRGKSRVIAAITAERATTEVAICFKPSLVTQYQNQKATLDIRNSLSDTDGSGDLKKLEKQIEKATIRFTLQALDRKEWRSLVKAHPPKENDTLDRASGFNADTFYDDLIPMSILSPSLSDEEWKEVDAALSEAQWQKLAIEAQRLNVATVDLPF